MHSLKTAPEVERAQSDPRKRAPADTILRAAIREQVGSIVKRLHREGTIENVGAGRATLEAGGGLINSIPQNAYRSDTETSARLVLFARV
jgi:hypothetical protein